MINGFFGESAFLICWLTSDFLYFFLNSIWQSNQIFAQAHSFTDNLNDTVKSLMIWQMLTLSKGHNLSRSIQNTSETFIELFIKASRVLILFLNIYITSGQFIFIFRIPYKWTILRIGRKRHIATEIILFANFAKLTYFLSHRIISLFHFSECVHWLIGVLAIRNDWRRRLLLIADW